MKRGTALCFLLLLVLAAISGCMNRPAPEPALAEGLLRLRVAWPAGGTADTQPKVIPQAATALRIRIWNGETGYNLVSTVPLVVGGLDLNIAVPEGTGYTVDVVSYLMVEGRATALTGGRSPNVAVRAQGTTDVQITLWPWTTESSGDATVAPGAPYIVRLTATDADGLITRQTFESATLHVAASSFQATSSPLPTAPGTSGVVLDDRITLTALAPNVTVVTTLHAAALVHFTSGWRDPSLAASERDLYIELPNRHMGEPLHRLVVDPSSGGIIITITGLE